MPDFKANCGCELYALVVGGCYGHSGDDYYCYCGSPEIEDAEIVRPCEKHGGSNG